MAIQPGHSNARGARRAVLAFVFLAPFLGFFLVRVNLAAALAPIFLSHVFLLYATLVPNCRWFRPVLPCFATNEPEVRLTIDDWPSRVQTRPNPALLDVF